MLPRNALNTTIVKIKYIWYNDPAFHSRGRFADCMPCGWVRTKAPKGTLMPPALRPNIQSYYPFLFCFFYSGQKRFDYQPPIRRPAQNQFYHRSQMRPGAAGVQPVNFANNMDKLASELQSFIDETEEQHNRGHCFPG